MKGLWILGKNKAMILVRGAFELLCNILSDPKYWCIEKKEIYSMQDKYGNRENDRLLINGLIN